MDAGLAVSIVAVVTGGLGLLVAIVNVKTGRDDLRQKAEINYVQSLERRVDTAEKRADECEERARGLTTEINELRSELLDAIRANRQMLRHSTRPRRPDAEPK